MKFGMHDLELEQPDLGILTVRGEAKFADACGVGDALVAMNPGGRIFLMSVIEPGHEDGMSGEARKAFIERMQHVTLVAVAAVGGNFRARTLARVLDTAMRLLSNSPTRLRFFSTVAEARVWLAAMGCVACARRSAPERAV